MYKGMPPPGVQAELTPVSGRAAAPAPQIASAPLQYELYRKSTIGSESSSLPSQALHTLGMTLTDSVDDLMNSGVITGTLAMKILKQFDAVRPPSCFSLASVALILTQSVADALANKVKTKASFKVR